MEILYVEQNRWLLDCWFAKKLFTDHVFLANSVKVETNHKTLLTKGTEGLCGRVRGEIVMPRSQGLQSRDSPLRLFIFLLIQAIKLRNSTRIT